MVYAINYDLKKPGRDYAGLYDAIKSCGDWWHYLGSTWLVDTNLSADNIWAHLTPHIDENDRVLVVGLTKNFSGWLPKEAWEWLNQRATTAARF